MHFESMNKPHKTVSLSADQRLALEALCRRRKVEALVWKRARAFLLLDAGYDTKLVCEILDIGPTVLTEWQFELRFSARRQDNAQALMRHLYARPVVDVNMVAEIIGVTGNTASALISDMVSHGVLVEVTGQRRNRLFVFREYIELFRR